MNRLAKKAYDESYEPREVTHCKPCWHEFDGLVQMHYPEEAEKSRDDCRLFAVYWNEHVVTLYALATPLDGVFRVMLVGDGKSNNNVVALMEWKLQEAIGEKWAYRRIGTL